MTARFIAILLWLFLAHQKMTGGSHCAYCWLIWFCCTGHSMLAQSFSPLLLVQLVHPSQHSVWISNISLFLQFLCFPRGDLCALVNVAACPQLFHIFHVWLFEGGVGCVHQWQQMWLLCTVPAWPIIPISPTPHPPPIHPKCKTTCRVYNIYIKKWSNNNIFLVIKAKEVKIMKEVISCDVKWRVPKKGWKIPKGEEQSQIIPQFFFEGAS